MGLPVGPRRGLVEAAPSPARRQRRFLRQIDAEARRRSVGGFTPGGIQADDPGADAGQHRFGEAAALVDLAAGVGQAAALGFQLVIRLAGRAGRPRRRLASTGRRDRSARALAARSIDDRFGHLAGQRQPINRGEHQRTATRMNRRQTAWTAAFLCVDGTGSPRARPVDVFEDAESTKRPTRR